VSIPESKSAALRLFYALLDAWVNEYPIEPTDFARGYAETIFAMPVIPMVKDFKTAIFGAKTPRFWVIRRFIAACCPGLAPSFVAATHRHRPG
jgi:hypothetical protein